MVCAGQARRKLICQDAVTDSHIVIMNNASWQRFWAYLVDDITHVLLPFNQSKKRKSHNWHNGALYAVPSITMWSLYPWLLFYELSPSMFQVQVLDTRQVTTPDSKITLLVRVSVQTRWGDIYYLAKARLHLHPDRRDWNMIMCVVWQMDFCVHWHLAFFIIWIQIGF